MNETNEMMNGTIMSCNGGLYTVDCGGKDIFCRARGSFRHDAEKPTVGDTVNVLPEKEGDYAITGICSRKNSLIRPPLCNLDILFVCAASSKPEPSTLIIDKMVTIAEHNKITPVIVITKSELDRPRADSLVNDYRKCGFDAFEVSSPSREGIDGLRDYVLSECPGKISAVAGVSGVGKSTLLNALFPSLSQCTGEISQKISRGKNTTRLTELFRLSSLCGAESGYFADTPGFSMIDFVRFNFYTKEDLPFVFREFQPYLTECRYTKCTHLKEEGCAIIDAVKRGDIPQSRHESYKALYEDLKNKHEWDS